MATLKLKSGFEKEVFERKQIMNDLNDVKAKEDGDGTDNKNVILYTIKDCPKCKNLKNKLSSKGISFKLVEMGDEEVGFLIEKGFRSAPVLSINNDQMLDYKDALKWVTEA